MTTNAAAVKPQAEQPKNHFAGDSFSNRAEFAGQVDTVIGRMGKGVIVIDAQWGEGKSWFTERYTEHLADKGHKALRIDAFKDDYLEDPFLMIVAEITGMIQANAPLQENIKEKAAKVAAALLPITGKLLVNTLGRIIIGTANASEEVSKIWEEAMASSGEGLENLFRKQIEGMSETKEALKAFKGELTSFTSQQKKPVVIIIDELDRCRPDFAVKILEVIKHLFDVENLFFILSVNREQLERSIKGVYGQGIDAEGYVYKFVDLFLSLPKAYGGSDNFSLRYMRKLIEDNGMSFFEENAFWDTLVVLSCSYNLAPRDIDKLFILLTLSNGMGALTPLFLYFSVLKIKRPELFTRLKRDESPAWLEAKNELEDLSSPITKLLAPSQEGRKEALISFLRAAESVRPDISSGYPRIEHILPSHYTAKQAAHKAMDRIENPCAPD